MKTTIRAFFLTILLLSTPTNASVADVSVYIYSSYEINEAKILLKALSDTLTKEISPNKIHYQLLNNDETSARAMLRTTPSANSVVVVIGSYATRLAADEIKTAPIVATMVLNQSEIDAAKNMTGIVLDLPIKTEFDFIHRFLPNMGRVALMYSPSNEARAEKAQLAAKTSDVELILYPIQSPRDIPAALESIAKTSDVILGISDPLVYTPATAKMILLFSFQQKIPLIGLSSMWTKAGAIYSLDRDYTDLGIQTSEMIKKVISGTPIANITPETPRKVTYSINKKSASHFKVDIAGSLEERASEIFQ